MKSRRHQGCANSSSESVARTSRPGSSSEKRVLVEVGEDIALPKVGAVASARSSRTCAVLKLRNQPGLRRSARPWTARSRSVLTSVAQTPDTSPSSRTPSEREALPSRRIGGTSRPHERGMMDTARHASGGRRTSPVDSDPTPVLRNREGEIPSDGRRRAGWQSLSRFRHGRCTRHALVAEDSLGVFHRMPMSGVKEWKSVRPMKPRSLISNPGSDRLVGQRPVGNPPIAAAQLVHVAVERGTRRVVVEVTRVGRPAIVARRGRSGPQDDAVRSINPSCVQRAGQRVFRFAQRCSKSTPPRNARVSMSVEDGLAPYRDARRSACADDRLLLLRSTLHVGDQIIRRRLDDPATDLAGIVGERAPLARVSRRPALRSTRVPSSR